MPEENSPCTKESMDLFLCWGVAESHTFPLPVRPVFRFTIPTFRVAQGGLRSCGSVQPGRAPFAWAGSHPWKQPNTVTLTQVFPPRVGREGTGHGRPGL